MAFGRSWTAEGGYSEFVDGNNHRSRSWLAPCAMSMVVVGMLGALAAISFVSSPPPAPQPATLSQLMEKHAASSPLPYKHAVPYVTPVKHQLLRGACWLFSTVGVLEASYRKQGAEKGYLGAHEYLKLSEQAYGAVMARVCKENPACETGDADETWMGNTTEGGEGEWLYYLQKTLATTAAVPYSACLYTQPPSSTPSAPAPPPPPRTRRSSSHPHAATLYDLPVIKRALHATDRLVAMALALGQTYHFLHEGDGAVPPVRLRRGAAGVRRPARAQLRRRHAASSRAASAEHARRGDAQPPARGSSRAAATPSSSSATRTRTSRRRTRTTAVL